MAIDAYGPAMQLDSRKESARRRERERYIDNNNEYTRDEVSFSLFAHEYEPVSASAHRSTRDRQWTGLGRI